MTSLSAMSAGKEKVVVLGASDNPERYSNQAVRLLLEHGHDVIPVHPALETVEGLPVVAELADIPSGEEIDTLTVYVSPAVSSNLSTAILGLKPGRVIFNPGAESPELIEQLGANDIPVQEACTLVLLRTGQF